MNKNSIITILIVATLVVGGLVYVEMRGSQAPQEPQASLGEINVLKSNELTTTSKLCGTSSTLLIATSTGRQYAAIVNDGATTVYLELSGGPAVKYEGIRLNANGGAYEINQDNLYTGPIYCIADTSAASTTLTYK